MRHPCIGGFAKCLTRPANLIILVFVTALLPAETRAADKRDPCDPPDTRYESLEHAVQALSHCYLRRSVRANREYAAGLISDGDAIIATVGRGRYRRDQIRLKLKLKPDQSLVALWHVHGANGPERDLFSPTDVELVERLRIPFYLTDPTGFIRRLDPDNMSHTKPKYNRMTALRPPSGSLTGELIGHMNEEFVPANGLLASDDSAQSHYQPGPTTALPNSQ